MPTVVGHHPHGRCWARACPAGGHCRRPEGGDRPSGPHRSGVGGEIIRLRTAAFRVERVSEIQGSPCYSPLCLRRCAGSVARVILCCLCPPLAMCIVIVALLSSLSPSAPRISISRIPLTHFPDLAPGSTHPRASLARLARRRAPLEQRSSVARAPLAQRSGVSRAPSTHGSGAARASLARAP